MFTKQKGDGPEKPSSEEPDVLNVEQYNVPEGEKEEDELVRNRFKADKLLDDVLHRMNMYHLASEHYSFLNNACFTTPSIIVTSLASFLSFTSASHPEEAKTISLIVGFLGTLATILTALQSAYKYDTKAEMFRSAAAEYRLIQTRINACNRKDGMRGKDWAVLWAEIEVRMTELQKRMTYFPAKNMVEQWAREGRLGTKSETSANVPPWLVRYLQNLEDDGVQTEEDIRFISDEVFEQWSQPFYHPSEEDPHKNVYDVEEGYTTRYPKVVIAKLRELRDRMQAQHVQQKMKRAGGESLSVSLKPTTVAALSRKGMNKVPDLRLATDEIMQAVLDELIGMETIPMPVSWTNLEEMVADVRTFGRPLPFLRQFYSIPLSAKAQARCDLVMQKAIELQDTRQEQRESAVRLSRMSSDKLGDGSPMTKAQKKRMSLAPAGMGTWNTMVEH